MKPTVIKEARYRLTASESDFEILCALVGGVENASPQVVRLFRVIEAQLPNRTRSFSDFFAGTVRLK